MGKAAKGGAAAANPVFETGIIEVEPWPTVPEYQAQSDDAEDAAASQEDADNVEAVDENVNKDATSTISDPSIDLPLWGAEDASQNAPMVSKVTGLDSNVEWKPLAEVVAESVLIENSDDSDETEAKPWSVRRLHGGSDAFRSALSLLTGGQIDSGENRLPWKRVEPREISPSDDEEASPALRRFAVQVYFDGELRELIVDDLVPVRSGVIQLAHELIELPVEEANAAEQEGATESDGVEGDMPEPKPARYKAIIWPLLLEKAVLWLQQQARGSTAGRMHPLTLLGPCVPVSSSAGPGQATPEEADWAHMQVPRAEDFSFDSWDAWMRAKADAKNTGDEEVLLALESAGETAKEKKRKHLAAQLAAGDAEGAAPAVTEPAVAETPKKEKKQKRRKKHKKRRSSEEGFLPINTRALDAALRAHQEALRAAIAAQSAARRTFEILRVEGTICAKLCVSPGRVPEAGDGDEEAASSDTQSKELMPAEAQVRDNLLSLAAGIWKEVELELHAGQALLLMEVGPKRVRVEGEIGSTAPKQTFWLERGDLDSLGASFETWRFIDCAQDICRLDYRPDAHGIWTSHDLGMALVAPLPTDEADSDETDSSDLEVEYTLILSSANPDAEKHAELTLATFASGSSAIEHDILASFEEDDCAVSNDTSLQSFSVELGMASFTIRLPRNGLTALRVHTSHGLSVRILSTTPGVAGPLLLPVLDAWKELRSRSDPAASETLVNTETLEVARTLPGDWRCVARYSVDLEAPSESETDDKPKGAPLCAAVELTDVTLRDHLQIWEIDPATGSHVRRDALGGVWMPSTACAASKLDVLFLLIGDEAELPATTCKISLASSSGLRRVERQETGSTSLRCGTYVPNSKRLLFREYFESIPQILSMRISVSSPQLAAFKVQLISQAVAAQLDTRALGTEADEVVAEMESSSSTQLASVPGVVEFHAIQPEYWEQVRSSAERRLVVQAILLDEGLAGRAPYWKEAQFPEDYVPPSDNTSNQDEVTFELRAISNETFDLKRETAWEASMLKEQARWEAEEPGRAERAKALREVFRAGFFPADDEEKESDPDHQTEDDDHAKRESARMSARRILLHAKDESGQVVSRRCPVPANDEDEFLLDEYKARDDLEVMDESVVEERREQHVRWFQKLMRSMAPAEPGDEAKTE